VTVDANGDRLDLPWQIRSGMVVAGSFETERERQLALEVNASASRAHSRGSEYRRGVEDGRALYAPRAGWLKWLALADDGTLWEYVWDIGVNEWKVVAQLPPLPESKPVPSGEV